MKVPLLDLKAQYATIEDEINTAVLDVLKTQRFILGPIVQECEERIAEYCNCPHAVGVSSGTDALLMCLMAEGIGPGDEVITTPYTFFATVGCISRVGAKPVFVDICPKTYNLDPKQIESQITDKTKAIIPVHLFGQCADMDAIMEITDRRNLTVIEDAAQALGSEYKGRRAGSMGHYGCLSFFPSKNLGCAGDGGMVVTHDEHRACKLRVLRAHGSSPKYFHVVIGGNFRLDAIQAAIVLVKLRYLEKWTQARQANAARYRELFKRSELLDVVTLPREDLTGRHIYNQFIVRLKERRDEMRAFLKERSTATEVYYPRPMHLQECYKSLGYRKGDLPESDAASEKTFAIGIYPELTVEQQRHVVENIHEFCDRYG